MHGTSIGDGGLAHLARLKSIRVLQLTFTNTTDEGLKIVGRFPDLERLTLQRAPITDAGLAHLKDCKKLSLLRLYDTAVTDRGLRSLAKLQSLRSLSLEQTNVTDSGLRQPRRAGCPSRRR